MEASAVRAPAAHRPRTVGLPLLRLRTDDQLLALFRAGSDDAFRVLHDRYRQRLFAYARQMLSTAPRQDAEDVLQDVFVRAYGALRADGREVNVRAWLYRVAHNRCIDHLRRPVPCAADVFEVSRRPLRDPIEEAQRREDLARLVDDVGRLPAHQRSALLMREIDGLGYADVADALGVTVPAVKSLLVRARIGLVEAAEARDAACADIRAALAASCDRGVKAPARARRHMRTCPGCREYRAALRGMRRSFAALAPTGPLALAGAKLLGLGGGTTAAAGATGGFSAGGATLAGGAVTCKVAAVVCTAALTAGGAVEVRRLAREPQPPAARPAPNVVTDAAPRAAAPVARVAPPAAARPAPAPRRRPKPAPAAAPPAVAEPPAEATPEPVPAEPTPAPEETGGVAAPEPAPAEATPTPEPTATPPPATEASAPPPEAPPPAEAGGSPR